jgi:hypothetical protein
MLHLHLPSPLIDENLDSILCLLFLQVLHPARIAASFQQCTRRQGCATAHDRTANHSAEDLNFLDTLMQDELFKL